MTRIASRWEARAGRDRLHRRYPSGTIIPDAHQLSAPRRASAPLSGSVPTDVMP
jgi:hypothetical protein